MHICMLLPGRFPPDIRVSKEATALRAAGHEITLICRGVDQPERETVDGITVRRIPENELFAGPRGIRDGIHYVVQHVNSPWKRALDDLVATGTIDAIHVHDLSLVKTGLEVGASRDVPVVADLHENYPEAVRQWQRNWSWRSPTELVKRLFLPPRRLKRLERQCVQHADRVITVCEEARSHYLRDCGADPRSVTVIPNTVDTETFDPEHTDTEQSSAFDSSDSFLVSYIGRFGSHRGLETLIDAVAIAAETVPNVRLALVGTGTPAYTKTLKARARQQLGDRVTFPGWIPFDEVPACMASSDISVVPHARTGHTETTIPHKLFQAMAMASPLVVTDVPPLRRIVDCTESGVVVPAGDAAAMGNAVRTLATNPERRLALGTNGRDAVERTFNWEHDATRLRALYRELDPSSETAGADRDRRLHRRCDS